MHAVRSSVVFVAALLTSGLTACAGAAESDLFAEPPATSTLSKTEPKPGGAKTPAATKPGSSSPGGGTTTKPGGSTAADPSRAPGDPQGDEGEPGVDPNPPGPVDDCIAEVEGNDSPDDATPFASCIHGTVGGNRDTDFLRVVAPPGARKMFIEHTENDGRVLYRVANPDDPTTLLLDFNVFFDQTPELRVTPGSTYIFKVDAPTFGPGGGRERGYQIRVSFEGR